MITSLCAVALMVLWAGLNPQTKMYFVSLLSLISTLDLSLSTYYLKCWAVFSESVVGKLMIVLSLFLLLSMTSVAYSETSRYDNQLLSSLIMILSVILVVFFLADASLLLYTTFELSLIPIFMIIMGWGYQTERLFASVSMMFYTLTASLPLLASLIYLSSESNSSSVWGLGSSCILNGFIALSVAGAFLVKTPMFLAHLWLPKAHVEAPVYGSMLLAALLLKLGTWGLYLFFSAVHHSIALMGIFAISFVGCFVTSVACVRMLDMKLIIAYSSVAHMAMVVMVFLLLNSLSEIAGLGMMLTHGYTSAAFFYLAFMQYQRSHSRCLLINKASMSSMTSLSLFWFLVIMLNMAAPPSLNLLMELLVIINVMNHFKVLVLGLIICILAGTAYSLILYSSINQNQRSLSISDSSLSVTELLNVASYTPLGLLTIFISSHLI